MNDYERTFADLQQAINVVESAYYGAMDEEDQTELDDALEILKRVQERVKGKI